jgi:hypothetical protein
MKTVALGTVLRVESDTPGTYIPVGNLTQIGVPGPTKEEIDVTDFDSVASEFLAGLPDNGEISFSGFFNYANAGQALLLADALSSDAPTRGFQIEFTRQDVEFQFQGFVKSFVPEAPGPNDAYAFEGTIRVSGAVDVGAVS